MAAVRRSLGYRRYVLSLQYHGSSFLGFSWQRDRENAIASDGTDLRGYHSVEGRLRQALGDLTEGSYENIQVSSRTDSGVHALKNTCHVDIRSDSLNTHNIHQGLNFYLSGQTVGTSHGLASNVWVSRSRNGRREGSYFTLGNNWVRHSPMNELRILAVQQAPEQMDNPSYDASNNTSSSSNNNTDPTIRQQPATVDWNARFSATQRTYIYRILHSVVTQHVDWAAPFEWDRSWRVVDRQPLNAPAMQRAAACLIGTHDFSSFRSTGCQRLVPVVTLSKVFIYSQPYGPPTSWDSGTPTSSTTVSGSGEHGGLLGLGATGAPDSTCQLVTVVVTGKSFLYRQVRNMVGCLVAVGRGRLDETDVEPILKSRDRTRAPGAAPAHGLYLVDVQHGDFVI